VISLNMSATEELALRTPESVPTDAFLICDPLKIRGRDLSSTWCRQQDDDDDIGEEEEDSGLGADSLVGAETVSRIIDFFRQTTRPMADEGKVTVPEAPSLCKADDPVEACRAVLKPLAQLIKAKESADKTAEDVAEAKPKRKTPGRKKKKRPEEKPAADKDDVPSPGSKDDDDEYLPKKGKKASRARKSRQSTSTAKERSGRPGRPKKPIGFVGKCKYNLTEAGKKSRNENRRLPIFKAAITGPAIQAALKTKEADEPFAHPASSGANQAAKTVIKIIKPLFTQTCIIHRPFATEGEPKSELVIHETYLSRLNPYSEHRVASNDKAEKADRSTTAVDSSAAAVVAVSEPEFVDTGFEDQSSQDVEL